MTAAGSREATVCSRQAEGAVAGIVLGSLGVLSGIVWGILLGIGSTHFHYHTGA